MVRKVFKHDVSASIVGMTFDEAKHYCLSENYVLTDVNNPTELTETYLITVIEYDENGRILTSKYGK
jgi:hypothetical protein